MTKKIFLLGAASLLLLSGCQFIPKAEAPAESSGGKVDTSVQVVDPKKEAETELFNELGIQPDDFMKKPENSLALPSVTPTPPTLPSTDNQEGEAIAR